MSSFKLSKTFICLCQVLACLMFLTSSSLSISLSGSHTVSSSSLSPKSLFSSRFSKSNPMKRTHLISASIPTQTQKTQAFGSSSPSSSSMKVTPNGVPVIGNVALQPEYNGVAGEIQGLVFKSIGAYANSGAFGYVIGAVSAMAKPRIRQVLGLRGIHGAGFKQGKMWGEFCATFTFMENAVRIARNGEEDKWNSICGGALSGLYMSRGKPPQTMLQTAATYGGINYLFQSFGPQQSPEDAEKDDNNITTGNGNKSNKKKLINSPQKNGSRGQTPGNKRKRLVIRYE